MLHAFRDPGSPPPLWLMRQAGRYLPEYRALRKQIPTFLDFCYDEESVCEAVLQPLRRFPLSAGILFSDILVIPDALGIPVRFEEGEGPILSTDLATLHRLPEQVEAAHQTLSRIVAITRALRQKMPQETPLIGFAGSPWTLAAYILEGRGSRDFAKARAFAYQYPDRFQSLLTTLEQVIAWFVSEQVKAGAAIIQLFDSWAGILSETEFESYCVQPTRRIVELFKSEHPTTPVIGFPRHAGLGYKRYAEETGVDGISLDSQIPLSWAKEVLQPRCLVQGNLDSLLLAENCDAALARTATILRELAGGRFIFNLGHGVLPHTPVSHVERLCEYITNWKG
jgi:uroporphyrinogen decarboxylase